MTVLAVLFSGLLAGLLSQSGSSNVFGDPGPSGVLFSSGGGGVAVAVLLAAAVAMFVRRRVAVTGLSLAATLVAGASGLWFSSDLATVIAGGVLLGCTAVRANTPLLQAVSIASFLLGLLGAGAVEVLQYGSMPRRYADYLTESDIGPPVVVPVLCALAVVATLWAARFDRSDQGLSPVRDRRTVAAIALIPLGGLLLSMLFAHSMFRGVSGFEGRWYFGLLLVPVLFAAAALLPGRGGMLVLAGSAVLLTSTTTAGVGIDVSVDRLWTLVLVAITAIAVAAGAVIGMRWGRALVGVGVLALVCVTALFDMPPLDNVHHVAGLVIFPAASAYLYVSCSRSNPVNPVNPVPLTLGLAVPVAITVPMVVTYGWTAYTPLTSIDTSTFSPTTDLWLSTASALSVVILAGVGMWVLHRR